MRFISFTFSKLIISIFLVTGTVHAQNEFTVKEGDSAYTMKKYYLCLLKKGPIRDQDSVTAAIIQEGHMTHINRFENENKISNAGTFDGDFEYRGILIFNVGSKDEAEKLEGEDPAVKPGRLAMEILP